MGSRIEELERLEAMSILGMILGAISTVCSVISLTCLVLMALMARPAVPVPLPMHFDGHQPIGCVTGQNVEDHFWYTEVYVNFPEPNEETGRDGVWHKRWLAVTETKEKGEKACNQWLDAVHKFVKERYK